MNGAVAKRPEQKATPRAVKAVASVLFFVVYFWCETNNTAEVLWHM